MKYGTPRMIRGSSNQSILRNVAVLRERFPRQSVRQDMAIALNVATDTARSRGRLRPLGGPLRERA
jgi:hypothetical protein